MNGARPLVTPPKLDEQLDWAPPELLDEVTCAPLIFAKAFARVWPLGPESILTATPERIELVDELELLAQLPELPLILVAELMLCVLEELLQVYCHCRIGCIRY